MSSTVSLTVLCGRHNAGKSRYCAEYCKDAIRLSLEEGVGTGSSRTLYGLLRTAVEHLRKGSSVVLDDQNYSSAARTSIVTGVREKVTDRTVLCVVVLCTLRQAEDGAEAWARAWRSAASLKPFAVQPSENVEVPVMEEGFDVYRRVQTSLVWDRPVHATSHPCAALFIEWGCWVDCPGVLVSARLFWQQTFARNIPTCVIVLSMDRHRTISEQLEMLRQCRLPFMTHFMCCGSGGHDERAEALSASIVAYAQYRLGLSLEASFVVHSTVHSHKWKRLCGESGLRSISADKLAAACYNESTAAVTDVLAAVAEDATRPAFLCEVQCRPSDTPLPDITTEHRAGGFLHIPMHTVAHTVMSRFPENVVKVARDYVHDGHVLFDSFKVVLSTQQRISGQMRCSNTARDTIYNVSTTIDLSSGHVLGVECPCEAVPPQEGEIKLCPHAAAMALLLLSLESVPESRSTTTLSAILDHRQQPRECIAQPRARPTPPDPKPLEITYQFNMDTTKDVSRNNGPLPANLIPQRTSSKQANDGEVQKRSRAMRLDPNAPKKPLTPFFMFLKMHRQEYAERVGGALKDQTRALAAEWNKLTVEERKIYFDYCVQDKERFTAEMANYVPPEGPLGSEESPPPKRKTERNEKKVQRSLHHDVAEDVLHFQEEFEEQNDEWKWDPVKGKWHNKWDLSLEEECDPAEKGLVTLPSTMRTDSSATTVKKSKKKPGAGKPRLATLAPAMSMGTTFNENDDDG